jgi:serine/threonine protein kinase
MIADPVDLGYVRMRVPGFFVEELVGMGAFSKVFKATPSDTAVGDAVITTLPAESTVGLPPGMRAHSVPGDGNCMLHSIVHQLNQAGITNIDGRPFTPASLRTRALNHAQGAEDPRFLQLLTGREYEQLVNPVGWVGTDVMEPLAEALNVNILVYGSPFLHGRPVGISAAGVTLFPKGEGDDVLPLTQGRPTLTLLYNGYNHFDSVVRTSGAHVTVPIRQPSVSGGAGPLLGLAATEQPTPPPATVERPAAADAQQDMRPVAIKMFEERHRDMRDHECDILHRLSMLEHVPRVVKSLDLMGKPSLIISPAASKVKPSKGGVNTNKQDYARMLMVLQTAHLGGICHRDVKPGNVFKFGNRIILSDWSSSAPMGQAVPWAGTPPYYAVQAADHVPAPSDDLVALVMTVFTMHIPNRDFRDMRSGLPWRRALQHARDCNYAALRDFFADLPAAI